MSGARPASPGIPPPVEGDDDDVAWALHTANVQWQRGAHADAIQWLRRAVDGAIESGQGARASGLNRAAAELTEQMLAQAQGGATRPSTGAPEVEVEVDVDVGSPAIPAPPGDPSELYEDIAQSLETSAVMASSPPPPDDVDDDGAEAIDHEALARSGPAPPPTAAGAKSSSEVPAAAPRPPFAAFMKRKRARGTSKPPPKPRAGRRPEVPPVELAPSAPPDVEIDHSGSPEVQVAQPQPSPLPEPEGPDLEFRQSFLPEEIAAMAAGQASAPPTPGSEPAPEPAEPPPRSAGQPESAGPPESAPVSVGGVDLGTVPGLEDLPEDAQAAFAKQARLETLGVGEEVGAFAVALVLRGWVEIMPMIADCACGRAGQGEVVFTQGTLDEYIPLRVVAGETPTLVAVWEAQALEEATRSCPWVDEELREVADRFQALAGAVMGELGDRLDDSLRLQVTERCELRSLLPHEELVKEGDPVDAIDVVGGGRIELVSGRGQDATVEDELGPGDLVFGYLVPSAGAAPQTARAGPRGALVLHANPHQTHEMMMMVPTLLEILAS